MLRGSTLAGGGSIKAFGGAWQPFSSALLKEPGPMRRSRCLTANWPCRPVNASRGGRLAAVGNDHPEASAHLALVEGDRAAVQVHEFGRDREPQARAAASGGALEGREEVGPGALRYAGPIVLDGHDHPAALPLGDDGDQGSALGGSGLAQ